VTTVPCNSEAARLLPWFVTGRLDADDTARVEGHLAACPACRADLAHERALLDVVRKDGRAEAPDPAEGFQKLMARIGETERALPARGPAPEMRATRRRRRTPRWVAAAVLAHALALAIVGAALWRHTARVDEAPYRTLTSDARSTTPSAAHLRVVFAPGTTTQELAAILDKIDARIVDGPSPAGAYALTLIRGVPDEAVIGSKLAALRADARVILAEPIRAEPAP
jgi:anti-sigma factor RsiW